MALETKPLERKFRYNSVDLPDPGAQYMPDEVRGLYAATYPEIVNAAIEGPEEKDGALVYTFRRAVGTKGVEVIHPTGAQLIEEERARQIEEEEYDSEHDDEHTDGSLALAAAAYASPRPIYVHDNFGDQHQFNDAWPENWLAQYDKRPRDDEGLLSAVDVEPKDRIRCLVKAGALCAAEVDRILRAEAKDALQVHTFPSGASSGEE